jgi:gliding motility-associated-like protein
MKKLLFIIALIFNLNIFAQVYVPNSFTPNNDGINDYMMVYSDVSLDIFELTLYNRFGEVVWYTKTPEDKWDGGDDYYSIDGVYTYVLKYRIKESNFIRIKRGHITLIR